MQGLIDGRYRVHRRLNDRCPFGGIGSDPILDLLIILAEQVGFGSLEIGL